MATVWEHLNHTRFTVGPAPTLNGLPQQDVRMSVLEVRTRRVMFNQPHNMPNISTV